MKISYIIPVYNVPEVMLLQCVNSIASLSFPGIEKEIIVIDDGSTLPLPPLQGVILLRQPNQGASVARNAGLDVATGDYIHFVDADDYLLAEPYTRLLDILLHEAPDLLSLRFTFGKAQCQKPQIERFSGKEFLMQRNLHSGNCVHIFRRSLIADGLRFEPHLRHEDERLTPLLYLRAKSVVNTNIQAYFYRQRSGSLQHAFSPGEVEERLHDYRSTIHFLQGLGEPALRRRIDQLQMDYIYNSIILCHNAGIALPEALPTLPHRHYTFKFWLFSYLTASRIGRWLLCRLLPLLPQEI